MQQPDRRTGGKKRDRGKVAAQNAEKIQLAMRQITDTVLIEIQISARLPVIAHAFYGPLVPTAFRDPRFDRMKIARENIFTEAIVVRIRAES